ncbi:acetate/propionate family kinase [Stakelama sp. CBK3Z-3]|uniref:Acetate kinase n=1 Tax=Stakelama flava TaxID=2860338 RepID=A0ABS6XJ31_9SPHN|nr:acetate/propionate family kinase [Stakelama flava]MBW4330219.1 acetate/propionate family kinase [Stakelama flava]
MTILCLNAGSSSLKFAMFAADAEITLHGHGKIENIGDTPHLLAWDGSNRLTLERRWETGTQTHETLLGALLEMLEGELGADLSGVGHRVVHGGDRYTAPVTVDAAVLKDLDTLCPLAPLHQPHNLAGIRAVALHRPGLPQIACFDTAFHQTQSETARRFALPRRFEAQGVRRYGFHGLSYEYIVRQLRSDERQAAAGRVIAAHLGNGASLCAMRDGRSMDTTMGFTALDGLVMGTRCGTIDAGVLLYLMQQGMDDAAIEHLLYSQSGLLGVSGLSNDMRTLLASDDPHAAEAVALFVYRIVRETGGLAASLGGLDRFVFTGGIGENAAEIRARVAAGLGWLGAEIDPDANARGAQIISTPASRVQLCVVATDEERMIAMHTADLLKG